MKVESMKADKAKIVQTDWIFWKGKKEKGTPESG